MAASHCSLQSADSRAPFPEIREFHFGMDLHAGLLLRRDLDTLIRRGQSSRQPDRAEKETRHREPRRRRESTTVPYGHCASVWHADALRLAQARIPNRNLRPVPKPESPIAVRKSVSTGQRHGDQMPLGHLAAPWHSNAACGVGLRFPSAPTAPVSRINCCMTNRRSAIRRHSASSRLSLRCDKFRYRRAQNPYFNLDSWPERHSSRVRVPVCPVAHRGRIASHRYVGADQVVDVGRESLERQDPYGDGVPQNCAQFHPMRRKNL